MSDYDPYRCPTCDTSLMRGHPPDSMRPGIYRPDYLGVWFGCAEHGIVLAKYDARRIYSMPMGDPDWGPPFDEAIDLLVRCQERITGALLVEVAAFLRPIVEEREAERLEFHCLNGPPNGLAEPIDHCGECGRYWQKIDGVWFRGDLPARPAVLEETRET